MMTSYQGFAICSLLMEINSFFLHLRKLMKMNRVDIKTNIYYRINSLLVAVTMILFRIVLALYVTYYMIVNRGKISLIPYTVGSIGACVLLPTNIGLSYRVIASDFLRKNKNN